MARRTFTMVDVTEILEHWYAGRPKLVVAQSLGVDVKTVRRYTAPAEAAGMTPGGPPVSREQWRELVRQWFPQVASAGVRQVSWGEIAQHHDRIAALVGVVPVSVIHQRLAGEAGLEASVASVRRYVRAHFPDRAAAGQVKIPRPAPPPGAEAQVDYGYLGMWPDPQTGRRRRMWAFSMVLPYSRYLFVQPAVSMTQRAWCEAHVAAFEFLGGVPGKITPDNLKAGVCKPDLYDPKINRAYDELARHYGTLIDPARAYHPTDKASIEAHQKYIRSSFFAGRSWPSLAAMTDGALTWCVQVAGQRRPRALEGRTAAEVFAAEEAPALGPLPDIPFEAATWSRVKVAPDAHVTAGRTLYSVPYRLIGTYLDVRATPALVEFFLDGDLVKTHSFQPRGRRTDWEDLPASRTGFFMRTPHWCQAQARLTGPACAALVEELLSINALFRLRQAQGVLRLGERHGGARLEAACARALEAGDPSYRTVKGILAAGTEHTAIQLPLPGFDVPAWLHGPGAFGGSER